MILYNHNGIMVETFPKGVYSNAGKEFYKAHDSALVMVENSCTEVSIACAAYIASKLSQSDFTILKCI